MFRTASASVFRELENSLLSTLHVSLSSMRESFLGTNCYTPTSVRYIDAFTGKMRVRIYSAAKEWVETAEITGDPTRFIIVITDQDSCNLAVLSWMQWRSFNIIVEPDPCHR